MKDHEFIELLNLYLDHEIGAEGAARLEAEVTNNLARRRIYRQYCQMDRACSQLSEKFEGAAPEPARVATPARRSWSWSASVYAGGLAAAACVVVVAVLHLRTVSLTSEPMAAAAQPNPAQARAFVVPQPTVQAALAVAEGRDLQPVVAVHNLFLNNPAPVSLLTAMNGNDPLAWMTRVQTASMPVVPAGQIIFTPSPVLINSDNSDDRTPARQSSDLQAPVEMAAFRFQR